MMFTTCILLTLGKEQSVFGLYYSLLFTKDDDVAINSETKWFYQKSWLLSKHFMPNVIR